MLQNVIGLEQSGQVVAILQSPLVHMFLVRPACYRLKICRATQKPKLPLTGWKLGSENIFDNIFELGKLENAISGKPG